MKARLNGHFLYQMDYGALGPVSQINIQWNGEVYNNTEFLGWYTQINDNKL